MVLFFTRQFKKDYKKLSADIQRQTNKKLDFLLQDINHPSLRIKKVRKYKNVFELSVNMQYRCLFRIEEAVYYLDRIGKHDEILK